MFETVWKSLGEGFGSRWLLTSFGPALAFWGASLLTYGGGTNWEFVTRWYAYPDWFVILLLASGLVGVVFTAYLLDLFGPSLLQLAEGYGWERVPIVGARMRAAAAARRQQTEADQVRFSQLQVRQAAIMASGGQPLTADEMAELLALDERLYYRPPDPAHSMPTAFGDILRAAEDGVRARYGLDPVVCWPRLYPVLPDGLRADLGAARGNVDATLRIAALAGLYALVWTVWSLAAGWWILAPLVLGAGVLAAWMGYRAAVTAAVPYADLIRAAFDLHRFDLYRALGWRPPRTPPEERAAGSGLPPTVGQRLSQYLRRGDGADDIVFQHAPPAKKERGAAGG
jgi:hypothetical protein